MFTRSISHDNGFLVHDYSLLENYSSTTLSNVTSGSVIATTSFIENQDEVTATDHPATLQESGIPATPTGITETDETPWWLEHKENRECEDQDNLPSHPLILMVYAIVTLQYSKCPCQFSQFLHLHSFLLK